MNKTVLNYLLSFFLLFTTTGLFSQVAIQGEAYIISDAGETYIISYDQKILIDSDTELSIPSYLYLTLKTNAAIKSISAEGILYIRGDGETGSNYTLTVGSATNKPVTAIQCDALEIANNIDINIVALSNGISSNSFIEIRGGNHSITAAESADNYALIAPSFIMIKDDAEISINGLQGISTGDFIMDGSSILTANTTNEGITSNSISLKNAASAAFLAGISTANSVGIKAINNIIVDNKSSLSGAGNEYGIISLNGIIRADSANILGTTDGSSLSAKQYNAIHAPGKIYGINNAKITEVYNSANISVGSNLLTTYSVLANNMTNKNSYLWDYSNGNATATRSRMMSSEKVKIDNNTSEHIIVLEGATEGPTETLQLKVCATIGIVTVSGVILTGTANITDYGGIPAEKITSIVITAKYGNDEKFAPVDGTNNWLVFMGNTLPEDTVITISVDVVFSDNEDGKYTFQQIISNECNNTTVVIAAG